MAQFDFVRVFKEGDEQGILEIMKLSGIEQTNESWLWKYKNNPFGNLIGVAERNRNVVGHMALLPTYLKLGGTVILGSQAVDLAVHPKFRRQGIFLAIGRMLTKEAGDRGIDIAYGFPNAPAYPGHLKYDWFDICMVPVMIKPINMKRTANFLDGYRSLRFFTKYRLSRSIAKSMLQIGLMLAGSYSRISNRFKYDHSLRNVEIHTIDIFDDRIEDFWEKASRDYPIIVVRHKKYLNWRYFEKPDVKYTVLLAERDKKVLGYIVLLIKDGNSLRVGYIVDIMAFSGDSTVFQSLILEAIEDFRKKNVDSIVCWMMNNSIARMPYNILKSNGFIKVSSTPLIGRVNSSRVSKQCVGDYTKWYVTIGDSDIH